MLFPIGDDNQGRLSTPFITYVIVALNAVVFLFLQQAGQTQTGERFTYGYAVVPYEITTGEDLTQPQRVPGAQAEIDRRTGRRETPVVPQAPGPTPIYLTLLTSMFMHGGWMHIIGNMLYLWIFGDNVEDNFGHGKFLIFYLICGLVASFAQIVLNPSSVIPSLGASGAIAGVLGAYLIMFPRNRVRTILPLGFLWTTIELPAVVVLGFWIVLQVISQYTASISHTTQTGGVAYMAHIGGFVAGVIMAFFLRRKTQKTPYYDYN
jgi:membrane associated rhomboid family serine protease